MKKISKKDAENVSGAGVLIEFLGARDLSNIFPEIRPHGITKQCDGNDAEDCCGDCGRCNDCTFHCGKCCNW